MDMKPNTLIDILGGSAQTARMAGVRTASVSEWRSRGVIPRDRLRMLAPEIEVRSGGELNCEAVCPDVTWLRRPDGRPFGFITQLDNVEREAA